MARIQTATIGLNSKYAEQDFLFESLSDLVNNKFKAWYCKLFYKIGRERVQILASQARADGKDSQKLFSHLLKREINRDNIVKETTK